MTWFRNTKVGGKLLIGFVSLAVISAAIGAVGVTQIYELAAQDTRMYQRITLPLKDLAVMSVAFQRVRINVRDAMETPDPAARAKCLQTVTELRQVVNDSADRFEKTIITDEARRLFQEYKESRALYLGYVDKMVQLKADGRSDEAFGLLHGAGKEAAARQQALLEKLMDSKEKQGQLTSDHNTRLGRNASILMVAMAALGALIATVLGVVITRSIVQPLREAVGVANRLATGDLTADVHPSSTDESGQLLLSMQNMVGNLRQLVRETVSISTDISSAATQLQATSETIATGAEEVACQAGTVATASEEMAATSTNIAANCVTAADASRQTTESANAGARIVKQTIGDMTTIAERVRLTSQTVEALGAQSEQIGEIVGTIEEIADQTNLLALNAAIEAARAGDQGRGFAVVADEVRVLAVRTTQATKEIGQMIKSIQKLTADAVQAMDARVKEVERGACAAQESGTALEEILFRINEVALQVSQMATAAEQQTATTSEVSANILEITSVAQQSARGAEETANAAGQLARQAHQLHELIGRFTL